MNGLFVSIGAGPGISLGGKGIAVACDLSVDEEIRSLFERVRQESGHLNILVK